MMSLYYCASCFQEISLTFSLSWILLTSSF
jgi:hypothetical protein